MAPPAVTAARLPSVPILNFAGNSRRTGILVLRRAFPIDNDGGAHGKAWPTEGSPGAVRGRAGHPLALGTAPEQPQALALRSKIVLACAEGRTNQDVAAELSCSQATVGKWRSRFVAKRLQGLADEYRPGAPRTVTDDHVERVVVKTLTEKPKDATHWSTRAMAKATGMSQPTVSRIWKAFGLKPWLEDTFKLSSDPLFIDKVRDIVGLYMNPPERAVVICVDEKTQVQALDRTQPVFPLLPGTPERRSHDYVRHGTIDLYAALNLTTGMVIHQLTNRHRAIEFKKFLNAIDTAVPTDLEIHVVLD